MHKPQVSSMLLDIFQMLVEHLEGSRIHKVLSCTESSISLLLENNTVVVFSNLEDELIVDVETLELL